MIDDGMAQRELGEGQADGDFLREILARAAGRIMELERDALDQAD
ncbi:MAG: hypothetical protein ACXIUV_07740 [Alkalilacustris sp.]